jgi:hypothetical protein
MTEFFRFPHTPHLSWLGAGAPRDDKVLAPAEVAALLSHPLLVEEKVDGANLGLSVSDDGELRAQNRGSFLAKESAHPQFKPLWPWLSLHHDALLDALWPDLMLFGEWCHAVHSIRYDHLPDWFLAFDVYDRKAGVFWDSGRRDALVAGLGLASAPRLGFGNFDIGALTAMLGRSALTDAPMEGLIVRQDAEGRTLARAKLVNAAFTQAIDTHWSKGALVKNRLASPGG